MLRKKIKKIILQRIFFPTWPDMATWRPPWQPSHLAWPALASQKPGRFFTLVQSCKPGCECDDGYVRESNLPSAMCVPTFICDAIRCGENEVWNYCGVKKSCVRTCEEVRKEFMLGQLDDNFKIERMNKALIGCRFNDCSADCECRTG